LGSDPGLGFYSVGSAMIIFRFAPRINGSNARVPDGADVLLCTEVCRYATTMGGAHGNSFRSRSVRSHKRTDGSATASIASSRRPRPDLQCLRAGQFMLENEPRFGVLRRRQHRSRHRVLVFHLTGPTLAAVDSEYTQAGAACASPLFLHHAHRHQLFHAFEPAGSGYAGPHLYCGRPV